MGPYHKPHLHIMVSFSISIITLELLMSSYVVTCLTSTYIQLSIGTFGDTQKALRQTVSEIAFMSCNMKLWMSLYLSDLLRNMNRYFITWLWRFRNKICSAEQNLICLWKPPLLQCKISLLLPFLVIINYAIMDLPRPFLIG